MLRTDRDITHKDSLYPPGLWKEERRQL